MRNHPRLRGEHALSKNFTLPDSGSSPPTRGTQFEFKLHFVRAGITPAYAGNTLLTDLAENLYRDHPRLSGEHKTYINKSITPRGSPPPTRGTLSWSAIRVAFSGITPAYAGNTFTIARRPVIPWDHPRLRGEHDSASFFKKQNRGSPPPTRGTLDNIFKFCIYARITPAYAGNTLLDYDIEDFV